MMIAAFVCVSGILLVGSVFLFILSVSVYSLFVDPTERTLLMSCLCFFFPAAT